MDNKEKKYMIIEVGNPKCSFLTDEIVNQCMLRDEDDNDGCCSFGKCPYGKTLEGIKKDIAELWLNMPKADNTDPKEYADTLAQNIIDKALLGGPKLQRSNR